MTSITFATVICEADDPSVRGVHSARGQNSNPPCGVAQEGFLIPVIGSAVGVQGGGVEHMEEALSAGPRGERSSMKHRQSNTQTPHEASNNPPP